MAADACVICGGDGRIQNAFGNTTTCPSCHGSGRRLDEGGLLRDVTKTKPSHHRPPVRPGQGATAAKELGPSTFEGTALANEVKASPNVSNETKARLTREIVAYEGTHGRCTETFTKKVRKQLRPAAP